MHRRQTIFDESGRGDTTFDDSNLAHTLRDMAFDGAVLQRNGLNEVFQSNRQIAS
jgi:hypothetical protein